MSVENAVKTLQLDTCATTVIPWRGGMKHYKTCDIDDCLICDSWYREIRETDKPKQELTKIQLTYWANQTTRLSDYE